MATLPSAARIAELAAKDKAQHSHLTARIDRAAAIVLAGKWQPTGDPDTYIIRGYRVNGACECPDYTKGNAPTVNGDQYCKHRLARAMLVALDMDSQSQRATGPTPWEQTQAWLAFAQSFSHKRLQASTRSRQEGPAPTQRGRKWR